MGKDILGKNEVSSSKEIMKLCKALLAEFFGNFLLNFFICGSVIVASFSVVNKPNYLMVSLTAGLVVFVYIQSVGHVSGAHLNPAISLAMLSIGKVSIIRAISYTIAQCVGSLTGSAILKLLLPKVWTSSGLGMTTIHPKLTAIQGFGFEFFLGFILILVVCGVFDPERPEAKAAGPLAVGLTVALGHMGAINFTGASMNPARTFGSAVIAGIWENHWVYWLGPIAGGVVAAQIYHFILQASTPDLKIGEER